MTTNGHLPRETSSGFPPLCRPPRPGATCGHQPWSLAQDTGGGSAAGSDVVPWAPGRDGGACSSGVDMCEQQVDAQLAAGLSLTGPRAREGRRDGVQLAWGPGPGRDRVWQRGPPGRPPLCSPGDAGPCSRCGAGGQPAVPSGPGTPWGGLGPPSSSLTDNERARSFQEHRVAEAPNPNPAFTPVPTRTSRLRFLPLALRPPASRAPWARRKSEA